MKRLNEIPWSYRVAGLQFIVWDEETSQSKIHTVTAEEANNGWFWVRYALGLIIQNREFHTYGICSAGQPARHIHQTEHG